MNGISAPCRIQSLECKDPCRDLHPVYRQLLKMALQELTLMEEQIDKLDQEMASLLSAHQDVVQCLAEVVLRQNVSHPIS